MSEKQFSILLLLLVICGLFSWYLLSDSFSQEIKLTKDTPNIIQRTYIQAHPHFNYLHGLWVIPGGLILVMMLLILELPSYSEILKEIKKKIKGVNPF
jgi:di/tricarboxylate transporter